MKKILFALMALAFLTVSCEKETEVTVNLTWEDSDYFDYTDGWQASIISGAHSYINDADYDIEAIETKSVALNDAKVIFNVSVKSYENYTVVVFHDENANGKYDIAELASIDFGGVDKGEAATFDLSITY